MSEPSFHEIQGKIDSLLQADVENLTGSSASLVSEWVLVVGSVGAGDGEAVVTILGSANLLRTHRIGLIEAARDDLRDWP